jgi:hypothetical protein
VVAVGFTGCKKDDEDDAKANLVGRWAMTKDVWKEYENGSIEDEGSSTDFDNDDEVWDFKSDGTYKASEDGEVYESGTYSLQNDGKKLVINASDEDEDDIYTINKLSSSELVVYSEEVETSGGVTYKDTEEYTFKKL